MRFLTFLFIAAMLTLPQKAVSQDCYRLVFWNVENYFDTYDDTAKNDDAFTPSGENHWTNRRYYTKQTHIYKTLAAIGEISDSGLLMPLVVGMAEVENDKVLRDLCQGTPLRRFGYDFIHFDSPDRRGIDNALLYRKNIFTPFLSQNISVSDSSKHFFTRDILLVEGCTQTSDTIVILVVHLPSRRSDDNDRHRKDIAQKLRYIMDTLAYVHPTAAIVTMGDFNASPKDPEIRNVLMHDNDDRFVNLMDTPDELGSYKYQGHWSFLDQIIVSSNLTIDGHQCPFRLTHKKGFAFQADFLLKDDDKFLGLKPYRTYLGIRYLGGFSDHLPVYIDIQTNKKQKIPSN